MIVRNLCAFLFVYVDLRATLVDAVRERSHEGRLNDYEIIGEQKIRFTGNSNQYVEFNVTIPHLLDFAMCLWYKPELILNQNILFNFGRDDRQLIMWKIKKKRGRQMLILRIYDTVVMEQSIDNLITGQWYHLCQYWKGSIGLWAAFVNSSILAFGYKEINKNGNSRISTENATATLNHPRTRRTLHGEIYGFHLMSVRSLTNSSANQELGNIFDLLMALHKSNSTADLLLLFDNNTETGFKPQLYNRQRRQIKNTTSTTSMPPTTSTPCPPFPRIQRFLRIVRRVVQMVSLPVIRFAQGLVTPWRRKAMTTPRPPMTTTTRRPTTTSTKTSISTTEATRPSSSTQSSVSLNKVEPRFEDLLNRTEEAKAKDKPVYIPIDFSSLEQEIMVYESELEPLESRSFRVLPNSSVDNSIRDSESAEMYITSEELSEDDLLDRRMNGSTCKTMERNYGNSSDTIGDDAITHLGAYLQFVQLLYSCCFMHHNDVLISWLQTPARIKNAVNERVTECGNF